MSLSVAAPGPPTLDRIGALLLSDRADVMATLDAVVRRHAEGDTFLARELAPLLERVRPTVAGELVDALCDLLDDDLLSMLVAAWPDYVAVLSAGREMLEYSTTLGAVRMMPHTMRAVRRPSLSLCVDDERVLSLDVMLDARFTVAESELRMRDARLVEVTVGNPAVEVVLSVDDVVLSTWSGPLLGRTDGRRDRSLALVRR